jgi:hypothetical protein
MDLAVGGFDVDHVIPLYLNGAHGDERNFATSCGTCNGRRKWYAGVQDPNRSDVWRAVVPRFWRGRAVAGITETTVREGVVDRRVPIITTEGS